MVERDGRGPLVGSGTTGEATGGGRSRSRVAGDGVGRRPSCIRGIGGVGRRAGVDTGLRARSGADVAGRQGEGVEKLGVAGARLMKGWHEIRHSIGCCEQGRAPSCAESK